MIRLLTFALLFVSAYASETAEALRSSSDSSSSSSSADDDREQNDDDVSVAHPDAARAYRSAYLDNRFRSRAATHNDNLDNSEDELDTFDGFLMRRKVAAQRRRQTQNQAPQP